MSGIVIVGAGHAGVQLTDSLRGEGFDGTVTLIGDEEHLPYQRPPLSKDFMAQDAGDPLPLRGESFYASNKINYVGGRRVVGIDRVGRLVQLSDGTQIPYDRLVLATGARHRALPIPGNDLPGVHHLRTLDDARTIQAALGQASRAVVVGAGFIGLEFAAAARARGVEVTVFEAAERPLSRALTPELSAYLGDVHRDNGVDLRLGEGVTAFTGTDRVDGVVGTSGTVVPADLVICGVGVLPNVELAAEAGLAVDDGITVEATLRTSDPAIFAVGDCCRFVDRRLGPLRLESVQNATEQARQLARLLTGGGEVAFASVPWFWSQQGTTKIQIAGLSVGADEIVTRGEMASGRFSVYAFGSGRLLCVESVNSAGEHLAARRILERQLPLLVEQARDPGFDIKAFSRQKPTALAS